MTLAPLLDAPPLIRWHAIPALLAFVLGLWQLLARKGTLPHRIRGWIWVAIMALVALSSFGIHTICTFGDFSVIHLLSIFTLAMLPLGVLRAHRHQVRAHRNTMVALFVGALVIAGGFTLVPGRVMHDVVFDSHTNDSNSCG